MRALRAGILLGLAALASVLLRPTTASATTLVVPSSYPTINAALAAASPGDTIEVLAGSYPAEVVVVAKAVSIVGDGPASTKLGDSRFILQASGVVLRGFTIGGAAQAVIVNGSSNVLEDLAIIGGGIPVPVYGSGNAIRGNRIAGAAIPLPIYGSDNVIEGNVFEGNVIPMPVYGPRNDILANVFKGNGIAVPVYGPSLVGGPGVAPFGPGENIIVGNTFEDGPYVYSGGNTLYHNNFLDDEARSDPTAPANTWDDGSGHGNHWGRYGGLDNGAGVGRYGEPRVAGDGIGDTGLPHRGFDWYPFMRLNGWIDSAPPETSIDSATGPLGEDVPLGGTTLLRSLRIAFSGSDDTGVASFECSADGAEFSVCENPLELVDQALGSHHFEVRAVDAAGKRDQSPAAFDWTVVTPAQALTDLAELVDAMPGESFTTPHAQRALANALQAAIMQLNAGSTRSCGTIELLQRDALRKVDGESPPADWVSDPHRQPLEDTLDAILTALREQSTGCP